MRHNWYLKIGCELLFASVFLMALVGCKGKSMTPAAQTYFEGQQLALAKLVDQADAEAVFQMARSMSMEEVNAFGKENMTVLHYAGKKTSDGDKWNLVVTRLIQAGADPALRGLYGDKTASLLDWAIGDAFHHNLKLLVAVLDAGVNPDSDTYLGANSPLIVDVAGQGHLDAIRLLVEHGADVNRRNGVGSSAIKGAISTLGLDEVNYLLDHGANPNVTDCYGVSFAWQFYEEIRDPANPNDPRLPKAYTIRDRIIKMGVAWPPENPEQLRARVKAEYKKKTGKEYIFMPDEGYETFVPPYVPAPVRKVPAQR